MTKTTKRRRDAQSAAENEKAERRELEAITDTMQHPAFDGDLLATLWPQIAGPDGRPLNDSSLNRRERWRDGITGMYQRCETYPQYTKIAVRLSGLPKTAWVTNYWIVALAERLLKQATPEQLVEALVHEQQHRGGFWSVCDHILTYATAGQLTGAVVEQLTGPAIEMLVDGAAQFAEINDVAWDDDDTGWTRRIWHVENHIRQHLLDGNSSAWDMFCGIAGPDTTIGDVVQLVNTVEQDDS